MSRILRDAAWLILLAVAIFVIAAPTFGANPSPNARPSPSAPAVQPQVKPSGSPDLKGRETPELAVTVRGTVVKGADEQGRPTFSLTAGGTTWKLSAGPPWFWGDKNPLAAYVGKTVTVVGSRDQDGSELDVDTVDGTAIRAPGKPPWAGGPWVVGKIHPGWKPWMADGKPGKGLGRAGAPGQTKTDAGGG